ncbi:MAG: hypothetical protein ABI910_05375 [Gemmatimonadota bacterium]
MIRKPLLHLAVVLVGVVGVAACSDSLGLRASLAVRYDTLSAYGMTSTPISFPAAYSAGNGFVVRVDPGIAFDVAFDLPGNGSVQLIPARRISTTRQVGGVPTATQRVGLQLIKGSFESLTKAPTGGYAYDSTFVVAPGEAVVMELVSDACQYSLVQQIYAKLVIDSIVPARRQIYFRVIRDPNCGFRSLQPGVPKS